MADLPDYYTQTSIAEAEAAKFKGGLRVNRPDDPTSRDIYLATDEQILYLCIADGVWTGFDAATITQGILTLYANMLGGGFQIKNIADPTAAQDAATRAYVLSRTGLYLPLAGGTMTGAIAMGTKKITGLAAPTLANDAVRKAYADTIAANLATQIIAFLDHSARHEDTGADEISVAGLAGLLAEDQHIIDAEAVSAVEAAGLALASGKNIKVISALTADHTWSGLTAIMTSRRILVLGQCCYVESDSELDYAKATAAATMPGMAISCESVTAHEEAEFLLLGFFRDDTWDWTPGGLLYVSRATAGALTQTLPAASGEQVQVVGIAITADIIYFNPSYELVEIS